MQSVEDFFEEESPELITRLVEAEAKLIEIYTAIKDEMIKMRKYMNDPDIHPSFNTHFLARYKTLDELAEKITPPAQYSELIKEVECTTSNSEK